MNEMYTLQVNLVTGLGKADQKANPDRAEQRKSLNLFSIRALSETACNFSIFTVYRLQYWQTSGSWGNENRLKGGED